VEERSFLLPDEEILTVLTLHRGFFFGSPPSTDSTLFRIAEKRGEKIVFSDSGPDSHADLQWVLVGIKLLFRA
jgi:hypothetical protein